MPASTDLDCSLPKGVTFGAVRFDADAKMKRVELRNESKFDFTAVICAKSAEIDELDELDALSFGISLRALHSRCFAGP